MSQLLQLDYVIFLPGEGQRAGMGCPWDYFFFLIKYFQSDTDLSVSNFFESFWSIFKRLHFFSLKMVLFEGHELKTGPWFFFSHIILLRIWIKYLFALEFSILPSRIIIINIGMNIFFHINYCIVQFVKAKVAHCDNFFLFFLIHNIIKVLTNRIVKILIKTG